MLLASYILFTVFCALPPVAASCGGKLPVARLPGGTQVYGFINETIPLVEQYLGIPFGASTAGAGRFAPPVPATLGATFNATVTPLACPQFNPYTVPGGSTFNTAPVQFSSSANISEDCLSVSVWAPKFVSRSDLGKLPVLIFIYGGGFILGASNVFRSLTRFEASIWVASKP